MDAVKDIITKVSGADVDVSSLKPLLIDWNACIRLPELNGFTITEAQAITIAKLDSKQAFENPDDPKVALLNRYFRAMVHLYQIVPVSKCDRAQKLRKKCA